MGGTQEAIACSVLFGQSGPPNLVAKILKYTNYIFFVGKCNCLKEKQNNKQRKNKCNNEKNMAVKLWVWPQKKLLSSDRMLLQATQRSKVI